MSKLLYVSGSIGLGHVTRDLAIAAELRRIKPGIEIEWLAENPAAMFLKERGEKILEDSGRIFNGNLIVGRPSENFGGDMAGFLTEWKRHWRANCDIYGEVQNKEDYDLIVADEAWDLVMGLARGSFPKTSPSIIISDHIGLDAISQDPSETDTVSLINMELYEALRSKSHDFIFVGQAEDIPDEPFSPLLPSRRKFAEEHVNFVDYVLSFDPKEYLDKERTKRRLEYGPEPLVVCSVGSTGLGKPLLKLCAQAHEIAKQKIAGLQMVLVTGPAIPPSDSLSTHGIDVKGYVPDLYEDLAAADLAIVTGGAMTTLELTALRTPFIYFPLEGHFEQQQVVAPRCERWKAGAKMSYSQTSPQSLADAIKENIRRKTVYPSIPIDGEKRAAEILATAMSGG